jgi:hypothetical protein
MTRPCNSIVGIVVKPPGCCPRCGSELATIDTDVKYYAAALRCSSCSALRGWLSHATAGFIAGTVRQFGTPKQPIVIRRGGVL